MPFLATKRIIHENNPLAKILSESKYQLLSAFEISSLSKLQNSLCETYSGTQEKSSQPFASTLVCTRNRGENILPTVKSILQNDYPHFELIVVDQSTNDRTVQALSDNINHPSVHYIRSDTIGKSRALNLGLKQAKGEFVLITDDDCIVPADWIKCLVEIFKTHSDVAITFCNVTAAPHDKSKGFIPDYERKHDYMASSIRDKNKVRGIGAGLAIRREVIQSIGGFDEQLGPGSEFGDCEDGDLAVRVLLKGWSIYETSRVSVIHYGFRTWEEGKKLTIRNWTGIGGAYVKPLKIGCWRMLPVITYEAIVIAILRPLRNLIRFQRPKGLKQIIYFCRGFSKGFVKKIDKHLLIYKSN